MHRYLLVIEECRKESQCIRSSSDTGNEIVRQFSGHLPELLSGFHTYDGLEIPYHTRERVRTDNGTDGIKLCHRVFEIIFKGSIDSLLECTPSMCCRNDIGTKNMHSDYIGMLFGHIDLTHVDVTLQTHKRSGSRQCHTVLSCTGLCDDLFLSHLLGKQCLS